MSTYLITGVNRGVGLELVKQFGADPKNTVIGTVRKSANTDKLEGLNYPNLHLLKVDMTDSPETFAEALKPLKDLAPNGIDVLIANAGVGAEDVVPLEKIAWSEFDTLTQVNYLGPVKVYRAVLPYLEANTKPMKIIFVSSIAGVIAEMVYPVGAYGASKAALNYIAKQISIERKEKGDIVVPVHPGVVKTDMMAGKEHLVPEELLITVEQCGQYLVKFINGLKPEDSGLFFDYKGEKLSY